MWILQGGANNILRGEFCQPSLNHDEKLFVHGGQPAALQTGTNNCLCACDSVVVGLLYFISLHSAFISVQQQVIYFVKHDQQVEKLKGGLKKGTHFKHFCNCIHATPAIG